MNVRMTDERLEEIRKRAERVSNGGWYSVSISELADEDVPELLVEIDRLTHELEKEREAKTEIIEELFGKRIHAGAIRIADELRKKLGESAHDDEYWQQRADEERAVFYDEED